MLSFRNIVLFLGLLISAQYINGAILESLEKVNHNLFAADLFTAIMEGKSSENVIYSPASIQTGMSLAFIGAEGETAENIRKVLRLGQGDKSRVAQNFGDFLKTSFRSDNRENAPQLKMAHRIYINENIQVLPKFIEIAREFFDCEIEKLKLDRADLAAEKINQWIERQTESRIKDIVKSTDIGADTITVLVNAIYFKGAWLKPFNKLSTKKSLFFIKEKQGKDIELMYNINKFNYADLPELEATALELPYNNTDISMLIILPNKIDGLEKLEHTLKGMDLNDIAAKMSVNMVNVYLPKYRLEFDIDLKEPLEKLGLSSIFSPSANFDGFFDSPIPRERVDKLKHKTYLDVNEAGSEATASTFLEIANLSSALNTKTFRADHPFVFAIRCNEAVYFAGHLAKI